MKRASKYNGSDEKRLPISKQALLT
jgi:hypothetical protein